MTRHEANERMTEIFSKHCNLSNEEYMAFVYEVELMVKTGNEVQISMDPVMIQMKCFQSVVDFLKRSKLITDEQRKSLIMLVNEIYDDSWLKLHEGKDENANRCVACGEIIPEGGQVCRMCMARNQGKERRMENGAGSESQHGQSARREVG